MSEERLARMSHERVQVKVGLCIRLCIRLWRLLYEPACMRSPGRV